MSVVFNLDKNALVAEIDELLVRDGVGLKINFHPYATGDWLPVIDVSYGRQPDGSFEVILKQRPL